MSDLKRFEEFIDSKADKELHPGLWGQIKKLIREFENQNKSKGE